MLVELLRVEIEEARLMGRMESDCSNIPPAIENLIQYRSSGWSNNSGNQYILILTNLNLQTRSSIYKN